jgi:predicted DNA-binding transcriptional regulator AlpA
MPKTDDPIIGMADLPAEGVYYTAARIRTLVAKGEFPFPIRNLGDRKGRWRRSAIRAWVCQREKDAPAAQQRVSEKGRRAAESRWRRHRAKEAAKEAAEAERRRKRAIREQERTDA